MRQLTRALMALCLLVPYSVTGNAGESPAGPALPVEPARTKEFASRIDRSIEAGTAWLRNRQESSGEFSRGVPEAWGSGATALAVLTLRICGVDPDDPAIARGVKALRGAYPPRDAPSGTNSTYGVSLTLLALEAVHEADESGDRSLSVSDREWIAELVGYLERCQAPSGGFGYGVPRRGASRPGDADSSDPYWDHSNSQFAMLGLAAGRRLGETASEAVWLKALHHWLRTQAESGPEVPWYAPPDEEDGRYGSSTPGKPGIARARGWTYGNGYSDSTGSMTAGGVSSIALCREALAGAGSFDRVMNRSSAEALRDGLAWLGSNFTVDENPGRRVLAGAGPDPLAHHYYLYSLERAGVLAGAAWMGRHDWYGEGAEHLLGTQSKDGSWVKKTRDGTALQVEATFSAPQVDSCFALLFLKRASRRLTAPPAPARGVATEDSLDPSRGPSLDDEAFRELFGAVLRRFSITPAAQRRARSIDFVKLGPRCIPLLILGMADEDAISSAAARSVLEFTTPGPSPGASLKEWESWWMDHRLRLRSNLDTGTFDRKPE